MIHCRSLLIALVSVSCAAQALAFGSSVGEVSSDGPPTPEQISLYLPLPGPLDIGASAIVRYRKKSEATWVTAHPLHRIRVSNTAGKPPPEAFAGVITGLEPGTSYAVEVAVSLNGTSVKRMLTAVTRPLPAAAARVTRNIAPGSSASSVQGEFNKLNPGDVLQFSNGTYTVDQLRLRRSGTPSKPIYIRGESRAGAILTSSRPGSIIQILEASDVIIENLTLVGSNEDSSTRAASRGIVFWGSEKSLPQRRITIRQLTIKGVDMGIVASKGTEQLLIYDNTLVGNNVWEKDYLQSNRTWNDDGIRVPGHGNAVFNNSLIGFGDSLAMNAGVRNSAIHFYRNEIRYSGDDAFEGDYGTRNITFYDNRVHNAMTLVSFDPIYGGPALVFRNIGVNIGRSPYKFNNRNTGLFVYNNTVVRTKGHAGGARWGWNQPNNGPLVAWGYRNNILIYRGPGNLMAMEAGGQDPIDFTHNAWYPDRGVWWSNSGGSFRSLASTRLMLPATSPVFSGSTKRHEADVITEPNPFVEEIKLGDDYLTPVERLYAPVLANGAVPMGKGAVIPGITDGFSGDAPDMGALITGRPLPRWGDRTTDFGS